MNYTAFFASTSLRIRVRQSNKFAVYGTPRCATKADTLAGKGGLVSNLTQDKVKYFSTGGIGMSHLRFVIHIARSYSGYGLSQADLIQEGNLGLMKAVKRFDPNKGVRLVSFAVHWIKAEIH